MPALKPCTAQAAATPVAAAGEAHAPPVAVAGFERLFVHRQFHSRFLSADRDIIVYVPEGYDAQAARRYPVLYLHDGQNLFDGRTSYIAGCSWKIHETADLVIAAGNVEPLIIVGIYNTGIERLLEYTPTPDSGLGGGEAPLYGRLLIEELKPFIDRHYRTLGGPEHTGLGGSSLGGLVSLYLGLEHPGVFGKLAVLSPSVWWARRSILTFVRHAKPHPRPRVWLDMGALEASKMIRDADLLYQLLLHRGWTEGDTLLYTRVAGGKHDESAWAQRVGPLLQFLFPR